VTLANVAATAQVKQGLSVFDVSGASAFGGDLQAGVRIDRKPDGNHVELRFHATDVDGAQIAKAFGLTRLFPQATGTASLMLKGMGRDWETVLDTGEGQVSVSFGAGKVPGIDLAGFIKRAKSAGFFPLSAVGKGTLAIDSLNLKATMSGGVATLDKAEVKSGDQIISFAGLVPFVDRGLALSGTIYPAPKAAPANKDAAKPAGDAAQPATTPPPAETRPTAAFFVGGSWSAPYISPIYPSMMPE
jgi:AsmA protein